jgi:hypothetical protein
MPTGIYTRTEVHNRKIGEANKGKVRTEEMKAIQREIKKKNPTRYWQGKTRSKETNRKISETKKSQHRHHTEEHKRKIGLASKGNKYASGHKKSDKWKLRMRGENSPAWRGGISFEPYSVDWTKTLKQAIRERDHFVCQLCLGSGYPVHHIDYNKKNCNPENLITLCEKCNSKVNFNRDYWQDYFTKRGVK